METVYEDFSSETEEEKFKRSLRLNQGEIQKNTTLRKHLRLKQKQTKFQA